MENYRSKPINILAHVSKRIEGNENDRQMNQGTWIGREEEEEAEEQPGFEGNEEGMKVLAGKEFCGS